jgi:hypothetical protein
MQTFAGLQIKHMIDLTNRTVEEVNELIKKYSEVLMFINPQEQPYMAIVIDSGIKHIQENYKDLPVDWKAWSIVYLKHKYLGHGLKKQSDIPKMLDAFIKHYNENYEKFVSALGMSASDYDRDHAFVTQYLK